MKIDFWDKTEAKICCRFVAKETPHSYVAKEGSNSIFKNTENLKIFLYKYKLSLQQVKRQVKSPVFYYSLLL